MKIKTIVQIIRVSICAPCSDAALDINGNLPYFTSEKIVIAYIKARKPSINLACVVLSLSLAICESSTFTPEIALDKSNILIICQMAIVINVNINTINNVVILSSSI